MNKNIFFLLILFLSAGDLIIGKTNNWTKDEDAVVIYDHNIFKVTGGNTGIYTKQISIRINNANGKDYCEFVLYEDPFIKIKDIKGIVKDTLGNKIKELKSELIKESSFTFGTTLHSDAIHKYFTLDHFDYPFIIDVSFEKDYKSLFLWPAWMPEGKYPVLTSDYKLILQSPVKFQTYTKGNINPPEISKTNNDSIYYWSLDSIPARPDEPLMAPEDETQYQLLFAPKYFATAGVTGSLISWDTFAEWYRKLCRNKYDLERTVTYQIDKLIKNASSDREKIELIYAFMQDKTRYVSIDLGIGGWQPYSANEVYSNRFGDCKDLSTFMIAALKQVGIKSYPVLIKTRDKGIVYKDFPYNYFNHVITVVPLENDTLWLENTADHILAGELSWRDEGCNVFVVTDSSGTIVTTPISKSYQNTWKSKIEGEISPQGDFIFNGTIHLTGNQKHEVAGILTYNKTKDFEDWLRSRIGSRIPGFKLETYSIERIDTLSNACIDLNFAASINKFGNKTGKRLFINPNILNEKTNTNFEKNEEREYPIKFNYAFIDIDTVSIKLPYGYKLEAAPEEKNLDYPFGKYLSTHKIKNDIFTYYRHFEYKTNLIPAEQYDQVAEFANAVIKKDQTKYVLKKH
jgi:hypothetical protein